MVIDNDKITKNLHNIFDYLHSNIIFARYHHQ